MNRILLCWLGRTDLRAVTDADQVGIGLIAQALATGRFARLELLCDYPAGEAAAYLDWLRARTDAEIIQHPVTLPGPTDFEAIYRHARALAQRVTAQQGVDAGRLSFHLSPGTPAMAAVWTPGAIIDADDARDAPLPSPATPAGADPILAQDIRTGIDLAGIID
jgi:hypothetical protein